MEILPVKKVASTSLLLLPLWLSGCGPGPSSHHPPSPAAESPRAAVEVRSLEVSPRSEPQFLTLSGTLRSRRDATLSSKLAGRITYLRVEEGDPVGSGEVVVQIDTSDVAAQTQQAEAGQGVAVAAERQAQSSVASAQAAVAQAQTQVDAVSRQLKEAEARRELAHKEYQRQSFLASQGAVPTQRADQAQADLKVASAQVQQIQAQVEGARAGVQRSLMAVNEARAGVQRSAASVQQARSAVAASAVNLEYGQLRAPFAGVVIRKMAFEGEVASPGKPLVQIQDAQNLELALNVPESQMERIRLNQRLDVEFPALGKTFSASVRQIVASTDQASRTFEARLKLTQSHKQLLPGMFGRVKLPQPPKEHLWIPASSLVERGGLQGVFLAGDKAEFRLIRPGERDGERLEVLSGLSAHERIVVSPPAQLQEGAPLKVTGDKP